MKTVTYLAVLGIVGSIPFSAFAQYYAGVSAGSVDHNQNRADWINATSTTSYDDTDSAYKISLGYKFSNNLALEASYADLGKYTARPVPAVPANAGYASIKTDSLAMFAVGMYPTGPVQFFGKIGFSSNTSKMTFTSNGVAYNATDSGSKRRASVAWGLGATYSINKQMAFRVEYEDFGKAGESNGGFTVAGKTSNSQPRMWSIGIQASF